MASVKSIRQLISSVVAPNNSLKQAYGDAAHKSTHTINKLVKQTNIIGIGISEKICKRKKTGKTGLIFYVEKKIDLKDIDPQDLIPKSFPQMENAAKLIVTDVIEIGKIVPQANIEDKQIKPGFSIGHAKSGNGTLGAWVTDGKNYYLLSNSHVIAKNGTAHTGDSIIYPGIDNGGKVPENVIAKLAAFKKFIKTEKFINEVDCAMAKPVKARIKDVTALIKGIGLPTGVTTAKRGMRVMKVGSATDKTTSKIIDADFHLKLQYGTLGIIGFRHQILSKAFTESGDSGALVIDVKTKKAVGLHFAGSPKGSVCNPIQKVLDTLKVKLVTEWI